MTNTQNPAEIAKAEALEAKAHAAILSAQQSFERCDTDGYLTQWASSLSADLALAKAELLREGKTALFTGLYEGERRVAARKVFTTYGTRWLLADDEAERFGCTFLPVGKNSRKQRNLGLREALERRPAWAKLTSDGTGLGGNVWVDVFPTGCRWGSDAIPAQES